MPKNNNDVPGLQKTIDETIRFNEARVSPVNLEDIGLTMKELALVADFIGGTAEPSEYTKRIVLGSNNRSKTRVDADPDELHESILCALDKIDKFLKKRKQL